ncbi:zinc ribbon domain-containing protein [Staphylococcus pettenkoferi]|uniref:zinc ribbon domain-containing protein n=1 Tax=Staphylococcus pettenkoferi TaxID=170573 RepID=UPI002555EA4A|nr:zinc ribbon domain-containing protein [Staphylococcus pettenkoferi]MDK7284278.1 zinc ribbon domain-containing protein [Staphylococcus pettenkoferi]
MYDIIDLKALLTFIQNDITKDEAKRIKVDYKKINKVKKSPSYIERLKFKDIITLNDYRIEKKRQQKNVKYVGVDIGTTHTLTASDKDMKRTLTIKNKRIANATKIFNRTYNNKNATVENIDNVREMLIRTIEANVNKLTNQLINHYIEPITFVVGEVYSSESNIHPHYILYSELVKQIKDKAKARNLNIDVITINEKDTSIICPKCNCKDKKNRTKSNSFVCRSCRYKHNNDDVIASSNIVRRFNKKKREDKLND